MAETERHERLVAAVEALPSGNGDMIAWLHAHGLGISCGPGRVLAEVRADLRKAAGLDQEEPS